jgi:predicted RNase H-like HicB family nuclease
MADMLDRKETYMTTSNSPGIVSGVSEQLHLTIVYESDPDSDWIVASIPEVPGANSQGRTKEEAREMVLDALAGISALRASEREPLGEAIASESLDIVSA